MKSKPVEGQEIVVYEPNEDREFTGVVQWTGSVQYTYQVPEEHLPRFAFYANRWRPANGDK